MLIVSLNYGSRAASRAFITTLKVPRDFGHHQLRLLLIYHNNLSQEFLCYLAFQDLDLFALPKEKDFAILCGTIGEYFMIKPVSFVSLVHHVAYSFP